MTASFTAVRTQFQAALAGADPGLPAADELCSACVRLLDVDGAAVSMIHDGATRGTFGSSSAASRRLDEYQFTFGEGPCLDAAATRRPVLVPDLDSPEERRWPVFADAVLGEGIRGVFALPIMIASVCVGALDLFRAGPGPMRSDHLAGALLAAELASVPLFDVIADEGDRDVDGALLTEGETAWGQIADMDRIEVYQATGMLISQLNVGATEALVRLRAHAMATGRTASQVARDIVERRLFLEQDGQGGAGRSQP